MKNINEYKAQTIGVEIEMTGISRNAATKVLEEHFGNRHTYIGNGCYDTRTVADETGRKWTIMRDSSIRPEYKSGRTAGDDYKVEFVTPILHYDDIEDLQEIVRKFRRAGATVNQSTGMHIHIGAKDFTAQTVRNLVNALSSKEDILYDALQVHPNRIGYCKKTDRRFLKELNEKKPQTLDDLARIWYNDENTAAHTRNHYDNSRYTLANIHSLFTKRTIEFRAFNATLHAGEVKAAIQFCLAITHQALNTTKAVCRKTETDNPKYAMRCWLLRLGLIGDEFKTCRLHMIKHLEGNSAWRQAA